MKKSLLNALRESCKLSREFYHNKRNELDGALKNIGIRKELSVQLIIRVNNVVKEFALLELALDKMIKQEGHNGNENNQKV